MLMKEHMPRKTLLLLLFPLLMLACKTLLPEPAKKPEPVLPPTATRARKTSTPRPASATTEADTPTLPKRGLTLVRLDPADGDLAKLLAAEVQKAATLGQMPVVEFDAPW
jgi:hypothetical protein